jgi:hypothetical protein
MIFFLYNSRICFCQTKPQLMTCELKHGLGGHHQIELIFPSHNKCHICKEF